MSTESGTGSPSCHMNERIVEDASHVGKNSDDFPTVSHGFTVGQLSAISIQPAEDFPSVKQCVAVRIPKNR